MKSLTIVFAMLYVLSTSNLFASNNSLLVTQTEKSGNLFFSTSKPSEGKAKKISLQGAWQRCTLQKDSLGIYHINTIPLLKFILADNIIMNMKIGIGKNSSAVISQGKYEHPSDSTYIEYLEQDMPLQAGEDNKVRVKFLSENLIELDFSSPKYTAKEHWIRVTDLKLHSQLNF